MRRIRAFNSLGYENFADPSYDGMPADLFYASAGPDRAVAEELISDLGLRPVSLGDLEQVEQVDAVAALWFALAFGQKRGRGIAFKVLTR